MDKNKLIDNIDFLEERDLNICIEIIERACGIFEKHNLPLNECVYIMIKTFCSFYGTVLDNYISPDIISSYHHDFKDLLNQKLNLMYEQVKGKK